MLGRNRRHLPAARPADDRRWEILVVSDGATDATDALVRGWQARGVRLVRLARRSGKAAALTLGVTASQGSLLVLTDANALLAPGALRALLHHFTNPRVGAV